METWDVLHYTFIGLTSVGVIGSAYLIALDGVQKIFGSDIFHKKIESQKDLDKSIKEEAEKLGLENLVINSKLYFDITTQVQRKGAEYMIQINKDENPTVSFVRHEMYHIYKGDCERKNSWIRYLLIEEPRAMLYGCFKIKI